MFNRDFFPTPESVFLQMIEGYDLHNKVILEPSAGKGNIVDFCIGSGAAAVIACEKNEDLRKIVSSKCKVIASDFLTVQKADISHVNMIIMNPPFSNANTHIDHAWEIAPEGCTIISLCNYESYKNAYSSLRYKMKLVIDSYGSAVDLGDVFSTAERKTDVNIGLIRIQKPSNNYNSEFEGFFLEEEAEEAGQVGIMSYNFVRDLVNRYVAAVKLYDEQLNLAVKMNTLTSGFYGSSLSVTCTEDGKPKARADFKKDLQKSGWKFIFDKMNMQKYATRGLKEDINKFVEQQQHVPFTMKNIYRMLEIVIGTQSQRMDRALIEVFDKITMHHNDNRYNVEGWKTNSHYLINEKFILPYLTNVGWSGQFEITYQSDRYEIIDDLHKALCYLTGDSYDKIGSVWSFFSGRKDLKFNTWYEFGYFEFKGYKKGSMHFKFKDDTVWGKFNQRISKLKGFPLFEPKKKSATQQRKFDKEQSLFSQVA